MSISHLGPVSRKMVKFKQGLSQVLSKVFLSKNMSLEITKYCCAFASRFGDDNIKCYTKQCIGRLIQKCNKIFNPRLALIGLSGNGAWGIVHN